MRIASGHLRGRPIAAPTGNATRPTTDRTRAAIFDALAARMEFDDAHALDLFAGTGALGFEALSRGALSCTFVETAPAALHVLRSNARTLGVEDACTIVRADVAAFLARASGPPYALVLADPPYTLPALATLPARVLPHVAPGGYFVLEHDARHGFADHPGLVSTRAYGSTIVSLFERPD